MRFWSIFSTKKLRHHQVSELRWIMHNYWLCGAFEFWSNSWLDPLGMSSTMVSSEVRPKWYVTQVRNQTLNHLALMGDLSRSCLKHEFTNLQYFTCYTAWQVQPISEFELTTPTMLTWTLTAVPMATYKNEQKQFRVKQTRKPDAKVYRVIGAIKARTPHQSLSSKWLFKKIDFAKCPNLNNT